MLLILSSPRQIKVIPNGFDEKRFKPIAHENAVTQLITVCRLVPAKGLDVLLHACAELKQKGHPFVLHIIGDGPIREELEALAVELDLYDDIIFYGYMLHPEEFMPFFDVFVLPSRAEAFGSVFAEAALCWLALVGTNVGGIAEQIDDGVNGLLVPPEDPQALADALEKVVTDPTYRYNLARAGWDKAKKVYSLQRVIAQLKKVYIQYEAGITAHSIGIGGYGMSVPFRFIHAADLHLDSPFRGLAKAPGRVREALAESTFAALRQLTQAAIQRASGFYRIGRRFVR